MARIGIDERERVDSREGVGAREERVGEGGTGTERCDRIESGEYLTRFEFLRDEEAGFEFGLWNAEGGEVDWEDVLEIRNEPLSRFGLEPVSVTCSSSSLFRFPFPFPDPVPSSE